MHIGIVLFLAFFLAVLLPIYWPPSIEEIEVYFKALHHLLGAIKNALEIRNIIRPRVQPEPGISSPAATKPIEPIAGYPSLVKFPSKKETPKIHDLSRPLDQPKLENTPLAARNPFEPITGYPSTLEEFLIEQKINFLTSTDPQKSWQKELK